MKNIVYGYIRECEIKAIKGWQPLIQWYKKPTKDGYKIFLYAPCRSSSKIDRFCYCQREYKKRKDRRVKNNCKQRRIKITAELI